MNPPGDPFREKRQAEGVLTCPFHGEKITMILRHEDVRKAAKDWKTFSSDAPFRVPIPSEESVRTMRQLPIETNPPEHGDYREIVEPFFRRAKTPEMIAKVEALVDELLSEAMERDSVDVVGHFALHLQSRALTYLLDVPESEADTWIGWGTHVFKAGEGTAKGAALEAYLHAQFNKAAAAPGRDFFSALTQAQFHGRPLTRDEMMGFGNLTFAGGRDTIIYSISAILAHLGHNPAALDFLREDPVRIVHASEEFFRAFMPLTQIGRVCPADTEVLGTEVKAGERIGLCWSSANNDETVFATPSEIRLDRKPNPHLSFGFGTHLCLGAPHARLLVRTLLKKLTERVATITVLEEIPHIENEAAFQRAVGHDLLRVALTKR